MPPNGRLLIVEMVLPAGDAPHPGKIFDMVMLVLPGGQERTEAEYAALLSKAGFGLSRVVPTRGRVSSGGSRPSFTEGALHFTIGFPALAPRAVVALSCDLPATLSRSAPVTGPGPSRSIDI